MLHVFSRVRTPIGLFATANRVQTVRRDTFVFFAFRTTDSFRPYNINYPARVYTPHTTERIGSIVERGEVSNKLTRNGAEFREYLFINAYLYKLRARVVIYFLSRRIRKNRRK